MATQTSINLIEGTQHNVVFTIPNTINLALYSAKIQVKDKDNTAVNIFEFSTAEGTIVPSITTTGGVTTQLLQLTIPASLTEGKNGAYKYQLMI